MARTPIPFSQEIADEICERLAGGESLRCICETDGIPSRVTIYKWIEAFPEFLSQYVRARDYYAESHVDDCAYIVDQPLSNVGADGVILEGKSLMAHYRAQLEQRKQQVQVRTWEAVKLKPKKYGAYKDSDADEGKVIIEGGLPE